MADREEIQIRLQALPPLAATAIAMRAAMRIFPILSIRRGNGERPFGYWAEIEKARHVLNILRCYQVSVFFNSVPYFDEDSAFDIIGARTTATRSIIGSTPVVYATDVAYTAATAAQAIADTTLPSFSAYGSDSNATAAKAANVALSAAFPPDTSDDVENALVHDIETAERRAGISDRWRKPLWPAGMPSQFRRLWASLQADLGSLNAGFGIWIDWYNDHLAGRSPDARLERTWVFLPDEVLKQEPAKINAYLADLRFEHTRTPRPDDPDDALHELPESQEPGLQFGSRADGKIDLKPSGLASSDDLADIAAMRYIIVEAIDDLIAVLDGSNAYGTVSRVAQRYRSTINADVLSIDHLFAYGVRLENCRARMEREIQSGDYPDLAVPAGEALDSVIALHGPMISSTERGKELLERDRAYNIQEIDTSAYKPLAQQVAEAIGEADDAVTEEARDVLSQASADIGDGLHPERSTHVARAALSNFLIAAAKGVQGAFYSGTIQETVEAAFKDGNKTLVKWGYIGAVSAAGVGICSAAPALWSFFLANKALLHQFALVGGVGGELSWLPSFLNWLEAQSTKPNE